MAASRIPFVRAWKYMSAWFGAKIDEKADPKIQIEQAIQEAQRQHQALTQQAAAVIGNQRQLEMQLDRQLNTVENLQAQARQALVLADQARADGDEAKAAAVRADRAGAGEPARQRRVVGRGPQGAARPGAAGRRAGARGRADQRQMLQQRLAERTKLLSQLEQAKMQETVVASLQQMSDLAAPSNVPTLDEVRDKIERRYAVALGQAELAKDSTGSRRARGAAGDDGHEGRRPPGRDPRLARRRDQAGAWRPGRARRAAIENPAAEPRRCDTTKKARRRQARGLNSARVRLAARAPVGRARARGGAPCSARRIGVRQRRQASPARSYTQCVAAALGVAGRRLLRVVAVRAQQPLRGAHQPVADPATSPTGVHGLTRSMNSTSHL